MDLSIIIVSWNVEEKLKQNLAALYASVGDFSYEVFVVDNDSQDETVAMVRKEFPQVHLVVNDKNLGFAKANNLAIKQAKGDFVLLLNPDMRVQPDTFEKMLSWMKENKQAAVAGCKLVDESGKIVPQVRRFPQLTDQLAIVLKLPHLFPGINKKYLCADFDYDKATAVDSIRGSFFMLRRSTIDKIGLLDERFFIWFEEVDYCRRVVEEGLQVWYTPSAACVDYVGQSFNQVPRGLKQKYFCDSMCKYFAKSQPAWQVFVLRLAWWLVALPNIFLSK